MPDEPSGSDAPLNLDRTADVSPLDRTVSTDHPSAARPPAVRHGVIKPEETDHQAGDRIGVYRLVQQLGQGSFGTVWLAERVEGGFRQEVALKLTRASASSRQQLQRFQFERQTLASLEHPGIARVFDGGDAGKGALYYVMELVRGGQPITAFCSTRALSIPDRLRLFTQACEALAYAHKQGVIHRDLSPNNILAYEDESLPPGPGRFRVKLIDFGLAKPVTGTALPSDPGADVAGSPLGTLAYASPEQIRGDPTTGTRSDVFALGAVLYELLVDSPPVSKDDLPTGRSRDELLAHISRSDPPPPSDRLSRMLSGGSIPRDKLEAIAKARRTTLDRLQLELREELNWLPMKALERRPDERYQSADELATDVRNYLALRPLAAHPPSVTYVARKFVRRNRGKVAVAGIVTVALVVSVVTIAVQYVETKRLYDLSERRLQEQRLVSAFQRDMLADVNPERQGHAWRSWLVQRLRERLDDPDSAVRPEARASRVSAFEQDMLALNTTDAATAFLAQVVEGAVPTIERKFKDMPHVQADLLQAIVQIRLGLGLQSDPTLWPMQQRVLELRRTAPQEPEADVLDALYWCAEVTRLQGGAQSSERAIDFARQALEGRERLDPPDPQAVAASVIQVAKLLPPDEAEARLRRVTGDAGLPQATRVRAAISLGLMLAEAGRFDEALRVLESARIQYTRIEDDRYAAADLWNNLGHAQLRRSTGLPDAPRAAARAEAVKHFRQALAMHASLYGDDHSITIDSRDNLALALLEVASDEAVAEARGLMEQNLRHVQAHRPPAEVVFAVNSLARVVLDAGQVAEALRLSDEVTRGAQRHYEAGHHVPVRMAKLRAEILSRAGRPDEAEAVLWRQFQDRLAWLAANGQPRYDRFLLDVGCDLQQALVARGRFDRLGEVFSTCDPVAAAGDDVQNDAKYAYGRRRVESLRAWSAKDPARSADLQRAEADLDRVKRARQAAGKSV